MVARQIRCGLSWIVGVLFVMVILAVAFIYSGIFNVSATYPDNAITEWALSTTMERSVKRHAKSIKVPNLNDPAMMRMGITHYNGMCVFCHGAQGVDVDKVSRQFNPEPPELTETANEWKPQELFWITKNGVRMTGMPAWGFTTSDKDIWSIVALMRKLPSMSPSQYKTLSKQAKPMVMK